MKIGANRGEACPLQSMSNYRRMVWRPELI